MAGPKRTREEVEKLKADWAQDPCWDLEDTGDGFDEYRDELLAFSIDKKEEWEKQAEKKRKKKAARFAESCTKDGIMEDLQHLEDFDIFGWDGEFSPAKEADANVLASTLGIKALMRIGDQLERIAGSLEQIANKPVNFRPNAK